MFESMCRSVFLPSELVSIRIAVGGAIAHNFSMASDVLPFADDSRYLPNRTNVISMADVSKKSVGVYRPVT